MQSVYLMHNPYKVLSTIQVNGEEPKKDSKLIQYLKQRFQVWVDKLPALLAEEYNDDEFEITFHGTDLDYQDLLVATKDAEKVGLHFVLKKTPAKEFGEKEDDIRKLFDKVQTLPFEELQSPALKDAFDKAFSEQFDVNVAATMSAGKSTLINALLGKKLMPSKQGACTATITRIRDDNDGTYKATTHDENGNDLDSFSSIDYELMTALNKNPSVNEIRIDGDIPFVDAKEGSLVLIDTPGPDNARTDKHRKVTEEALGKSSKTLVLFVMNGDKLHDDAQDLFLHKIAKSMSVGGKQSRERFIFVINKMDDYDEEDDNIEGETLPDTVRYLEEMGIENPNIFPAAALPALLIRRYQATFDENEKQKILDKLMPIAKKLIRQEQLHLEKYPKLVSCCQTVIDKELQTAIENNDILGQALIHTGIRGIEETIRMYVTKYRRPVKIKNVVDTFTHELESAEAFKKTEEEITSKRKEREQIRAQIVALEKKLRSKDENEAFKKKISSLEITTKLSSELDELIEDVQKDLTAFFNGCPKEMDDADAKNFIVRFAKRAKDKQTEFHVAVEKLLEQDIKAKSSCLLDEYIKKLTALSEEFSTNGLKIDLQAFVAGKLEQLNSEDIISDSVDTRIESHQETRTRTVTKRARGWRRVVNPFRWFNPEYEVSEDYVVNVQEEISFISKEKLFNSTAGKIISSLHIERQRILNYAKDETKNIKDYFYVQFDEVDKILAAKANELSAALQSEDSAKKALEKARELLSKLTAVKQELEAILEV